MIIINDLSGSKQTMEWIERDQYDYDPDKISVTSLQKSVREIVLMRNFRDYIPINATELFKIRVGQAIHAHRANIKYDSLTVERRLDAEIEEFVVTGQFDAMDNIKNFPVLKDKFSKDELVLCDLKTTFNNYAIKHPYAAQENYSWQLAAYRWLAHENGIQNISDTGIISIIAFFPKRYILESKKSYHRTEIQIEDIPVQLLDYQEMEKQIRKKLREVKPWLDCMDIDSLPQCSSEYRAMYGGKKCSLYCQAKTICPLSPAVKTEYYRAAMAEEKNEKSARESTI